MDNNDSNFLQIKVFVNETNMLICKITQLEKERDELSIENKKLSEQFGLLNKTMTQVINERDLLYTENKNQYIAIKNIKRVEKLLNLR